MNYINLTYFCILFHNSIELQLQHLKSKKYCVWKESDYIFNYPAKNFIDKLTIIEAILFSFLTVSSVSK
jgi:hypothetical protein